MSRRISDLCCGDRVRFGAYCVNGEGTHKVNWIKVDDDSTFITERIEDFRPFDAREINNPDEYRRNYGNNRYSLSNIDQFLNSSSDVWFNKSHDNDEPPREDLIRNSTQYENHCGFLRFFEEWELDVIEDSEVTTVIPDCDVKNERVETISRKVFLPSITNIYGSTIRDTYEGNHWKFFINNDAEAYPTAEAVEFSNVDEEPEENETWYWLLRSPYAGGSCDVGYVGRDGDYNDCNACDGVLGVRPALKIKSEILVSDEPDDEGYYDVIQSELEIAEFSEDELLSILMK